MKLFSLLLCLAVLTHDYIVEAGFGKTPDPALSKEPLSPRRRWSSTGLPGMQGSHENMEEVTTVKVIKKAPQGGKSKEEEAFLEHHPYASGVFAHPHQDNRSVEG